MSRQKYLVNFKYIPLNINFVDLNEDVFQVVEQLLVNLFKKYSSK